MSDRLRLGLMIRVWVTKFNIRLVHGVYKSTIFSKSGKQQKKNAALAVVVNSVYVGRV